jgi:DNA-binding NarL/FixJ family response regulator
METIRALLVDDSPQFLAVAREFLAAQPGIEIAGAALSGLEALDLIERLHPDVVLLDLFMPEMNGFEATKKIKAEAGAPRIIIVTMEDHAALRAAAAEHGADGFVAKSALPTQLLPLIRDLCN